MADERKSKFTGNKRGATSRATKGREKGGERQGLSGEAAGGSASGVQSEHEEFGGEVDREAYFREEGGPPSSSTESPRAGESSSRAGSSEAPNEYFAPDDTGRQARLDEDREPAKKVKGDRPKQQKEEKSEFGFSGLDEDIVRELFDGLSLIAGDHWSLEDYEVKELTKKIKKIPTPKRASKLLKYFGDLQPYIGLGITLGLILKPRIEKNVEDYRVEKAKVVNEQYYQQYGSQRPQQPQQPQQPNTNGAGPAASNGNGASAAPANNPAVSNIGTEANNPNVTTEHFNPAYRGY